MMWQCLLALCVVCCVINEGVNAGAFQRRIIYRGAGAPMRNTGGCGSGPSSSQPRPTKPPKGGNKFKRIKITDEIKQKFVDAHNKARSAVLPGAADMVPVEWDDKIAAVAKKFVKKCEFIHSAGSERTIKAYQYPLGENLFAGMSSDASHRDPEVITKKWEDEKEYYNIGSMTCRPGKMCGHYTQVVWSTTKKIGCAIAACPSLKGTSLKMLNLIAVCNYGPPGNWRGEKPYKVGESCSACPADSSNTCKNNLCY